MKPGIYRLARDVKAPRPDKRRSDWFHAVGWSAGDPFWIEEDIDHPIILHLLPGAGRKRGIGRSVTRADPEWSAITEALEPHPRAKEIADALARADRLSREASALERYAAELGTTERVCR